MTRTVDIAYIRQFSDELMVLSQQDGSILLPKVKVKNVTGKSAEFERLGSLEAVEKVSPNADSPSVDAPHSRRRVSLKDFHQGIYLDPADEIRMLIQPKNDYARNLAKALGRKMDDLIITALQGNSTAVDADGGTSNVSITHTIDEDFGAANANLTIEKLIEARRIFAANEVRDGDLTFVYNPLAQSKLLQENEVQSADYAAIKALVRGDINTFMGFDFVVSNRVKKSTADATIDNCIAFAREGICYAQGKDIDIRITERDDKSFSTYIYAGMTGNAVRVDEDRVIVVETHNA